MLSVASQYFETNGVHQGIAELVNEQVKVNREASTFMEKLCENIQRKIREQGKPVSISDEKDSMHLVI